MAAARIGDKPLAVRPCYLRFNVHSLILPCAAKTLSYGRPDNPVCSSKISGHSMGIRFNESSTLPEKRTSGPPILHGQFPACPDTSHRLDVAVNPGYPKKSVAGSGL